MTILPGNSLIPALFSTRRAASGHPTAWTAIPLFRISSAHSPGRRIRSLPFRQVIQRKPFKQRRERLLLRGKTRGIPPLTVISFITISLFKTLCLFSPFSQYQFRIKNTSQRVHQGRTEQGRFNRSVTSGLKMRQSVRLFRG